MSDLFQLRNQRLHALIQSSCADRQDQGMLSLTPPGVNRTTGDTPIDPGHGPRSFYSVAGNEVGPSDPEIGA